MSDYQTNLFHYEAVTIIMILTRVSGQYLRAID